jgi:hypothetical protein
MILATTAWMESYAALEREGEHPGNKTMCRTSRVLLASSVALISVPVSIQAAEWGDLLGRFRIRNLPVGDWTFQVWHAVSGYVSEVRIQREQVVWRRGRSKFEIKPGVNDLGEVQLPPGLFQN